MQAPRRVSRSRAVRGHRVRAGRWRVRSSQVNAVGEVRRDEGDVQRTLSREPGQSRKYRIVRGYDDGTLNGFRSSFPGCASTRSTSCCRSCTPTTFRQFRRRVASTCWSWETGCACRDLLTLSKSGLSRIWTANKRPSQSSTVFDFSNPSR